MAQDGGKTKARMDGDSLSVIVPLYNEAGGLAALHERVVAFARRIREAHGITSEIVYVDDGSRDKTLEIAHSLAADGFDIQVVSLSRNFGKEAALVAGLDHARNAALLFMDGDGQHPPELADQLVRLWRDENHDVVFTAKAHRADESATKRFLTYSFYRILNWGARHKIPVDAGDFRLLSPRAAAALRRMPERSRFFKGLSSWIGYKQIRVPYEPAPRAHGRSSWSLGTLLGLSVEGLTAFSAAPLRFASFLGLVLSITALFFGGWILFETLVYGKNVEGYPSLFVGMMVIGGVQLLMIGIMGEYIAKILFELKGRPVYFVAEHELKEASEKRQKTPREAAE